MTKTEKTLMNGLQQKMKQKEDMKRNNKYKLVLVEWVDASTINGWSNLDEVIHHNVEPAIVHNVGYLIGSDKNCTSIAPAWSEETCDADEMFLNVQRIPKAFIRKIVDL